MSGTAQLQGVTSPLTIDSTLLTTALETNDPLRFFTLWHLVSLDITAIDHRALVSSSPSTFHEQLGPARTARALALIHQALFEGANIFEHKYASTLTGLDSIATDGASSEAAITEAAYQTIAWLYPGLIDVSVNSSSSTICLNPTFSISAYYACALSKISDGDKKVTGIAIGRAIAGRIIAQRDHDSSEKQESLWAVNFTPRRTDTSAADYPYAQWQIDPVSKLTTALGGYWGGVKPFALTSGFQFRPSDADAAASQKLTQVNGKLDYKSLAGYAAIAELGRERRLSESGVAPSPAMKGDSIFVAQFWAYDGTINVCAPARLYNQIAGAVLDRLRQPGSGYDGAIDVKSTVDVARFYALINIAMADAAVSAWDAKFYFQFPRPVTYIRAAQDNGNPTALKWFPLGAQNTNSDQPFNITPPFPSYPSGHAVFGGALFGVLRQFIKPDTEFSFMSDEFNKKNKDVYNYIRCSDEDKFTPKDRFCIQRTFTLDCAERENADSRLFMGVHWVFDADDGINMGNLVARQVHQNVMKPLQGASNTRTYSIDYSKITTRAALKCKNVNYPDGWDSADKGFGPLKKFMVVN
ncbi:vanadium-dependent haloperoxidase [Bradyrhizobium sp. 45]|nr:vanadium-dependent haloperoxidase [Bradyrhizobium sp. 45]